MPTDGADFGRMKSCYGKAYTAAKTGATNAEVAEISIKGLERDIRSGGGAPSFNATVDLVLMAVNGGGERRLLKGVETLNTCHADASLTRHLSDAAAKVGLDCLRRGATPNREEVGARILAQVVAGRCNDPMAAYITKNRTQSVAESSKIINGINARVLASDSLRDLTRRTLNSSADGMPARAPRVRQVRHDAVALNNEVIGAVS